MTAGRIWLGAGGWRALQEVGLVPVALLPGLRGWLEACAATGAAGELAPMGWMEGNSARRSRD